MLKDVASLRFSSHFSVSSLCFFSVSFAFVFRNFKRQRERKSERENWGVCLGVGPGSERRNE